MSTDSHDRLIAAFQNYFIWQNRFEYGKSDRAGTAAGYWLRQIRIESDNRKKEILAERKLRKKARNGKMGRPRTITST